MYKCINTRITLVYKPQKLIRLITAAAFTTGIVILNALWVPCKGETSLKHSILMRTKTGFPVE